MSRPLLSRGLVAVLCVALFLLAFVAAPRSCEWGLDAYVWAGLAVIAAMLVLPFLLHRDRSSGFRVGLALGYGGLAFVVWIFGFFAAGIRIFCRMF
jgi:heme/copper-type cytochrome/quinol oxidase subunit 4